MERQILADYEALLDEVAGNLTATNHDRAVALARYPEAVRGYGHVKAASIVRAEADKAARLAAFRSVAGALAAAAE